MDIAELGLAVRSDGVVVAKERLKVFEDQAGRTETATQKLARSFDRLLKLAGVTYVVTQFGRAIGDAVRRVEDMERMSRQVDKALENSGNSARTSAKEIAAWADMLERRTGRAAAEVMSVAANLATYGFGRKEFYRALELANDMAAAWGGDLRQNVEGLARALDDPIQGMAMLSKRGVKLTQDQKELALAFLQANDKAAAQNVVFQALEEQVKGVAEKGYGGLAKAWGNARKTWDDALEAMVQGTGKSKGLRDALMDLAEAVSSPALVSAVGGFATLIIKAISGIAQVVAGAMKALQDLSDFLNAPGGALTEFNSKTAPLENRSLQIMREQLASKQAAIAKAEADRGGAKDMLWSFFGLGNDNAIKNMQAEVDGLKVAIAARANPASFNVGASFNALGGAQTLEGKDALIAAMSPGSPAAFGDFDAYSGFKYFDKNAEKAATKAQKAYDKIILGSKQFIAEQQLEASALGMTEQEANRLRYTQELLNKAANDNIKLTPQMRTELEGYAAAMAAAEEQSRRVTEIYNLGKDTFKGFFSDLKSGLKEGQGFWESFGNAAANALDKIADKFLDMALDGIWDTLFGAFSGKGGGSSGGGIGGILGGLFGWLFPNAKGGVYASKSLSAYSGQVVNTPTVFAFAQGAGLMGEAGPEAIMPLKRTASGALGVQVAGTANQNQANDNGVVVQVIDQRSSGTIKREKATGPNGEKMVRLIVRDEVQQARRRGAPGF